MTKLIFDIDNHDDVWTNSRLQDEFFLCIAKAPDKKYYEQAKRLLFRIPLTEQYPESNDEAVPFIINWQDLSPRVQKEFFDYCDLYNKRQITLLLKEIVIRLFENLDFEYAHSSVMKKLRVKMVV
jgi:hypothetical protein